MGEVLEVNGPIISIHQPGIVNGAQVKVGELGIMGEVIHLREHDALVQMYESTQSLKPGEEVIDLGRVDFHGRWITFSEHAFATY